VAGAGADRLLADPTGDISKKALLMLSPPCRLLVLNYVGKVSTIPQAGAVHVCSAFGKEFYVDGTGLADQAKDIIWSVVGYVVESEQIRLCLFSCDFVFWWHNMFSVCLRPEEADLFFTIFQ